MENKKYDAFIEEALPFFGDYMFEYAGGNLEELENLDDNATKCCMGDVIMDFCKNVENVEDVVAYWFNKDYGDN